MHGGAIPSTATAAINPRPIPFSMAFLPRLLCVLRAPRMLLLRALEFDVLSVACFGRGPAGGAQPAATSLIATLLLLVVEGAVGDELDIGEDDGGSGGQL